VTPVGLVTGQQDGSYNTGGYGQGLYGQGLYGQGAAAATLKAADTWQLDNYGEDMVACLTSDGRLWYTTPAGGPAALVVGDVVPTANIGVVVTPERFLVALGAGGDGRNVAWASQEVPLTATVWVSNPLVNTAGNFLLSTKGRLMAGRRTRRQTLLWTDVDVYAMTFVALPGIYAFEQVGDNCGLIAPNAMAVLGDLAVWMSYGKFFMYDGALKPLQCDVLDYVFQNLNKQQAAKVHCVSNALFDEVIWFYNSIGAHQAGNDENDSYVAYNYREQHWMIGTLGRDAGIDRGVFDYPLYVDPNGFLWSHELGDARTSAGSPFAESGPIEIADVDWMRGFSGDIAVAAVNRFIPDEKNLGNVNLRFFASYFPTDPETVIGPFSSLAPTNMRFQARQLRVRVEENVATLWRVGVPRLSVVPGGRR
jgi:hypothetical protein